MNTIKIIALATILFLTGCSNSDLEEQNINLQRKLNSANNSNIQLSIRVHELKGLQKKLDTLSKKNTSDLEKK